MTKKEHKIKEVSQVEVHDVTPHLLSKRNLIIFGGLLVLVVLSAGWLVLYKNKTPTSTSTAKDAATVAEDFRLKEVNYEQSVSGNNPEVRKTATAVASTGSGKSADYVTAYGLALSSLDDGNFKKAVEQFEQALKTSDEKTYTFYAQVGLAYAGVGNNSKAVEYIKLAKTTYNNKQAPLDSQDLKDGINQGFDQQIAEYSK